jgi:hypothetical protein
MKPDIQRLHTTTAYQDAARQLLIDEANLLAQRLEFGETVSAACASCIDNPTSGVGGLVSSENYSFSFHNGKLRSIRKLTVLIKHGAHSTTKEFDPARDALVQALQTVFPEDRIVMGLR